MTLSLHEKALLLASNYKQAEIELLKILELIDKDKTYLAFGVSSLFRYCVEILNLSESESYKFIQVSRKSQEVPKLKEAIESGKLSLSKGSRIASVITSNTQDFWIETAKSLTHREIEREVARVNPKPLTKERIKVLTPEYSELKLNISKELEAKLKRAQAVFRTATLEETLESLVNLALKHKDPIEKAERVMAKKQAHEKATVQQQIRQKTDTITPKNQASERTTTRTQISQDKNIATERPASSALQPRTCRVLPKRYIPKHLLHQVSLRDRGQCTFKNCRETRWTEVHHIVPLSQGGTNTLDNLTTLCSAHHKLLHQFAA